MNRLHQQFALLAALTAVAAFETSAAVAAEGPADACWVYIGTYTSGKDGSKGIYRCRLDTRTGRLADLELAATVGSPSFLAISPNQKFLYAVGESSAVGEKKEGTVHAYAIDRKTGNLKLLNHARTGGPGPCHISVNQTGRFALVANYSGGSTALFSLKEDGSFDKQTHFIQHKGSSVNKQRQQAPHAHCGVFASAGDSEMAYVVDLGLDQVFSHRLDHNTGKLIPNNPPFVKLPSGSGPRHISLNPKMGKAYVCGELDSTLITLRFHPQTGTLERWQGEGAVLSTLPKDVSAEIRKNNSTAEVLVHPSGGHVFVSNRGHDSIATFRVSADKTEAGPHLTGTDPAPIKSPRNFNLDPTGKWILVANQGGGTLRVIEWDEAAGNGKMTTEKVNVARPVCVKFVAVE